MLLGELFITEFKEKTHFASLSDYSNDTIWTVKTKGWIKEILKKLKNEMKIEVSHEYYRIDSTGWIQRKEELNTGNSLLAPHLWDLIAAVEHENNSKEWLDEVCKLSYIRCPLRVVIGYGTESFNDKIAVVKDILHKTEAFTDDEQEFLIILGKHKNEFIEGGDNFTHIILTKEDI